MAFPRTITPRTVSPFRVPSAITSVGQSGKVQTRSAIMMGREWDETFPPLRVDDADTQALLAYIEDAYSQGSTFTIKHLISPGSGLAKNGDGTGTPLVNGASQTGSSLITNGWTATGTTLITSNPGFETGSIAPHSFTNNGGDWAVTTSQPQTGTYAARYDPAGQSAFALLNINGATSAASSHIQAVEGDSFYGHAYIRVGGVGGAANQTHFAFAFYTSGGSLISTSRGTDLSPSSTSYVRIAHVATAPATTSYVVPQIVIRDDGLTPTLRFDDMVVQSARVVASGDVLKVDGLSQLLRSTANTAMDINGNATLTVSPPIVAGSSPADNAALTVSDCTLTAYIAAAPNIPPVSPGQILTGLTVTFREAL